MADLGFQVWGLGVSMALKGQFKPKLQLKPCVPIVLLLRAMALHVTTAREYFLFPPVMLKGTLNPQPDDSDSRRFRVSRTISPKP